MDSTNFIVEHWSISPLEGEMSPKATEGVAARKAPTSYDPREVAAAEATPSGRFAAISPARGESAIAIVAETAADVAAREALLDDAMGPKRKTKSSEKLRRGRRPSEGLAFVARDASGDVAGTVRLWDVTLGEGGPAALLLGPLAVDPSLKSAGIGSALMRHAVAEAARLGHGAILLVGDAPYYGRFGFSAAKTGSLAMPGPYERHRLLALELVDGALDGVEGTLKAAGRKLKAQELTSAA
jgi:predicted N-acetyltransferase YhbS